MVSLIEKLSSLVVSVFRAFLNPAQFNSCRPFPLECVFFFACDELVVVFEVYHAMWVLGCSGQLVTV